MYMYIDMQIPVFQQLYILIVGISNFFDWLILSYANVLIIPRQAYLLKMKIVCKIVYLVSFLLEIKVLNLRACTCTYLNVLNIVVILYICCTFFQTFLLW